MTTDKAPCKDCGHPQILEWLGICERCYQRIQNQRLMDHIRQEEAAARIISSVSPDLARAMWMRWLVEHGWLGHGVQGPRTETFLPD